MDELEIAKCAIQVIKKNNQRSIGAAVLRRSNNGGNDDSIWRIDLYRFLDNEQFSNVDSFLVSIGHCQDIVLDIDMQDQSKVDNRKIVNLCQNMATSMKFVKKTYFSTNAVLDKLQKLTGNEQCHFHSSDTDYIHAYGCIECLIQSYNLLEKHEDFGKYHFHLSSLDTYMKLDGAASEAVHLLPHVSHPSKYGSLLGVLNRCKTKMGQRLLERWLRQPLLDEEEINKRLDMVQMFKSSAVSRNQLLEGPLHNVPDLELLIAKMEKKKAGLMDMYRIYLFSKTIPGYVSIIENFIQSSDSSESDITEAMRTVLKDRFLLPLERLANKFSKYQQLVEHVIDMSQLPDLFVSPQHDSSLQELQEELDDLEQQANSVLNEARGNWASFADVKLETDSQRGFYLRTTRGDDERQLRANNSKVIILSLQKNGVHFTTPSLRGIAERHRAAEAEYKKQQTEVVKKAVDIACTYLPVIETTAGVVAELDVLLSFATVAALSPDQYVRPSVRPRGSGVLKLRGARHPCVELMDDVKFIANDYDLERDVSGFQIITGPNMGGKSTYIRTIGCIAVMAQIGSFVPCDEAEMSVVDCILARVGAGDAVQRGVSTFMAEMLEAAVILRTATRDSLIIIDELGRGTSTFDGFGLAWAISEHIASKLKCLCVFATHFHELTALEQHCSGVTNKHVTAHIEDSKVVMLYDVQPGPCTQSFGIHVARMAGFPEPVLAEAKRKSDQLECVGETDDIESAGVKRLRMLGALQQFSALPVVTFCSKDIKTQLQNLFPSYHLVA